MTDVDHKRLAKELDRRRRRRRLVISLSLLALAIAALLWLRCGHGWGTKEAGDGAGTGGPRTVPMLDAATRCAIRVDATGIRVAGEPATRDEAIAACKDKAGADILITGDARQGDWDDLRAALDAAGIVFFAREPRGVAPADAGAADATGSADRR